MPGPVCYGLGNQQPTLTDANLVLGYLNQTHLLGGALPIDGEAAHRAIREHVAVPLGLDILEAAYGVHRIADARLASLHRTQIGTITSDGTLELRWMSGGSLGTIEEAFEKAKTLQ